MIEARDVFPNVALRLAGLVDGEGCFSIARRRKGNYLCEFTIKLRADDAPMLEIYRNACGGVGNIRVQNRHNHWAPTVAWVVSAKAEVGFIRDLFELYPLWSKKRRDFEIWKEAVDFCCHCVGYGTDWTPVAEAKERLHAIRRYDEELAAVTARAIRELGLDA